MHHSRELYIERKERRFQMSHVGCTDTPERKKKRRKQFEQEFLRAVESDRKFMKKNTSDINIIANYKKSTEEMF